MSEIKILEPSTTLSTLKQVTAKINRTKSHQQLKSNKKIVKSPTIIEIEEHSHSHYDSINELPEDYLIKFQSAYQLALKIIPAYLDDFKNIYKDKKEYLEINPLADNDIPDSEFIKNFKIDPLLVTSIILKVSINEIPGFDNIFTEIKAEISKIKETINVGTVDNGGYWNNYYGMLFDKISWFPGGSWKYPSQNSKLLNEIPDNKQKQIFYTAFQKLKNANDKVYDTTSLEKLKEYDLGSFVEKELENYFNSK
jgi:hypothetical protein